MALAPLLHHRWIVATSPALVVAVVALVALLATPAEARKRGALEVARTDYGKVLRKDGELQVVHLPDHVRPHFFAFHERVLADLTREMSRRSSSGSSYGYGSSSRTKRWGERFEDAGGWGKPETVYELLPDGRSIGYSVHQRGEPIPGTYFVAEDDARRYRRSSPEEHAQLLARSREDLRATARRSAEAGYRFRDPREPMEGALRRFHFVGGLDLSRVVPQDPQVELRAEYRNATGKAREWQRAGLGMDRPPLRESTDDVRTLKHSWTAGGVDHALETRTYPLKSGGYVAETVHRVGAQATTYHARLRSDGTASALTHEAFVQLWRTGHGPIKRAHAPHRIHFIHDERAGVASTTAAPLTRSIVRRLSPLARGQARSVGEVVDGGGYGRGTAFLIKAPDRSGRAWVMTNAHVAKSEANARALSVRFEDGPRTYTGVTSRVLFLEPGLDAAILEVTLPGLPAAFAAAPLLRREARAGEALHVIGFPGVDALTRERDDETLLRFVAAPKGTPFQRALKAISLGRESGGGAVRLIEGAPHLDYDAPTLPGSSGSPVFAEGGVLALNARSHALKARREEGKPPGACAVPMERILATLERTQPALYRKLTVVR